MSARDATTPKRRGHPPVDPWHSTPSVRAGLPTDRAAWLAIVLPVMDAGKSHPDVARLLTEMGHQVGERQVLLWHRKLELMQASGALPERARPLPERRAGWREGMPLPSPEKAAEGGRKGAVTKAQVKREKARKGPRKGGKGRSSQSSEFAASIRCARWTKTYRPSVQLREERPESA